MSAYTSSECAMRGAQGFLPLSVTRTQSGTGGLPPASLAATNVPRSSENTALEKTCVGGPACVTRPPICRIRPPYATMRCPSCGSSDVGVVSVLQAADGPEDVGRMQRTLLRSSVEPPTAMSRPPNVIKSGAPNSASGNGAENLRQRNVCVSKAHVCTAPAGVAPMTKSLRVARRGASTRAHELAAADAAPAAQKTRRFRARSPARCGGARAYAALASLRLQQEMAYAPALSVHHVVEELQRTVAAPTGIGNVPLAVRPCLEVLPHAHRAA